MRTLKISLLVFILSISASSQNFWQQTNGPFGGNIYSMEISSNGNIFIGTSRAGIYKTSNNGDLWYSINQGIEYTNG